MIDYEYSEEMEVVGVQGWIKPKWHSNCSFDRDVRLRYTTRDGSRKEVWTKASGERGVWIIKRTEPGIYKARIFREVRRYRIDGERRKVLCHGDASPELKMPRRAGS